MYKYIVQYHVKWYWRWSEVHVIIKVAAGCFMIIYLIIVNNLQYKAKKYSVSGQCTRHLWLYVHKHVFLWKHMIIYYYIL
jgi:hypothetical protein